MEINIRKQKIIKKNKWNGRYSLFLDIYLNGKRKKEYLKLTTYSNPTPQQRQLNKEALEIADKLYTKRKSELQTSAFGFRQDTSGTDFIQYFTDWKDLYDKKDFRTVQACHKHFTTFIQDRKIKYLPGRELTKTFCEDFANYLKTKLKHETPKDYFKKFRQVINRAYDQRIIEFRSTDVKVKYTYDDKHIRKLFLRDNEIKKLLAQPIPDVSNTICRAYILCLNTGIDYSTVKSLVYANIDNDILDFQRPKTKKHNRVPLNKHSVAAIGTIGRKDELIFQLPDISTCIKHIRAWATAAGIHKKITWHSARHTFATQILRRTDLKSTADLLGQSDLRQTMKYLHAEDERKKNAVNSL